MGLQDSTRLASSSSDLPEIFAGLEARNLQKLFCIFFQGTPDKTSKKGFAKGNKT